MSTVRKIMIELVGNVLFLQLGKPNAMFNVTLGAFIHHALNYECIEELYGCPNGVPGLMKEEFIDLAGQSQKQINCLLGTPGAALKALPYENLDMSKIVPILQRHNIKYVFVMGDVDSVEFCRNLEEAANKSKYEMRIVLIPFESYNLMPLTDHCLGFGSMAKHIAVLTKCLVKQAQSQQPNGSITIIELAHCSNEWLLSSMALARGRKDSIEAPQMILLSQFDEGTFVKNIHQILRTTSGCVIGVGSKLVDVKGEDLTKKRSAAEYVEMIAKANFDVQVDRLTLHDWDITSPMTLSEVDVTEASLCAEKALELAVTVGISGKMITLLRTDGNRYASEVNCVDLENVSIKEKKFPEEWYVYEEMSPDVPFFKYAAPLIAGEKWGIFENGLPVYTKFEI